VEGGEFAVRGYDVGLIDNVITDCDVGNIYEEGVNMIYKSEATSVDDRVTNERSLVDPPLLSTSVGTRDTLNCASPPRWGSIMSTGGYEHPLDPPGVTDCINIKVEDEGLEDEFLDESVTGVSMLAVNHEEEVCIAYDLSYSLVSFF